MRQEVSLGVMLRVTDFSMEKQQDEISMLRDRLLFKGRDEVGGKLVWH